MTGYLVAIIAALLMSAGTLFYGIDIGQTREIAKQKNIDDVVRQVSEAAQAAAATAIASQQPINRTIVQKAVREIETNTVYRECVNTPEQLRNINAALTGRTEPASDSKLPGTGQAK